jgi:hypothetical protein
MVSRTSRPCRRRTRPRIPMGLLCVAWALAVLFLGSGLGMVWETFHPALEKVSSVSLRRKPNLGLTLAGDARPLAEGVDFSSGLRALPAFGGVLHDFVSSSSPFSSPSESKRLMTLRIPSLSFGFPVRGGARRCVWAMWNPEIEYR